MKLRNILSRPLSLLFGASKKPEINNSPNKDSPQDGQKPQEVIVVQTKGTKAAFYRDWVMACFFAMFAGITVYDRVTRINQTDGFNGIIRELDLNKDGKISKEELETVRELLNIIEKRNEIKTSK